MSKRFVCRVDQCPREGLKAFQVEGGLNVVIASSGDEFHAFQAICPHMDVALEEGFYDGRVITCHQHLWQWDAKTGEPIGLAEAPLQRYELREEEGALYVVSQNTLSQTSLFAGVSDETLEAIGRLARSRSFEAGEIIYRPGDPANDLCVLESGRIQFAVGRDERTQPAGFTLRVGEIFGWAALLDDQTTRIATAVCLEASRVLLIDGRRLVDLLAGDPTAGFLVMKRLASLITRHLTPTGSR